MEKLICRKCGKVNDEGNKHCSKCKAVLNGHGKEAKPHQKIVEANTIPRTHAQEKSIHDIKPVAEALKLELKDGSGHTECAGACGVGKIVALLLVFAVIAGGLWYYNRKNDLVSPSKAYFRYCEGGTVTVSVPKDNYIPFCKSKNDAKLFYHSFKIGDDYEIENMLRDKRMLYLDYYTKILIIEKDMVYARVRVLDGVLKGMSGWVYLVEVMQFEQQKD